MFTYLFQNITFLQTVLKNTFWLTFAKVLGSLFRAVLLVISARLLGAEEFGYFSLAMSFVMFFSFLPEFGLTSVLIREVGQKKEEKKILIASAFFTLILLSIIALLFIFGLKGIILKPERAKALVLILSLMLIFDIFREFFYSLFRVSEEMEKQAFSHVLTNFAILIFGFLLLWQKPTAFSLAFAYTIGVFFGLILTIWLLRKELAYVWQKIQLKLVPYFLKASWPIGLANFIFLLLTYLDTLMLGWFRSISEVGWYQVAVRGQHFLLLFPAALAISIFPALVKSEEKAISLKLKKSMPLALWLAFPIVFGVFLVAEEVVVFLFGAEFLVAAFPFKILTLTILFQFPVLLLLNYLIASDLRKALLKYDLLTLLFNFLLNLILIPEFGFLGAALATLLSVFLLFVFLVFFLQAKKMIVEFSFPWQSLLSSLLMFSILHSLTIVWWLKIVFGVILFLFFLLIFRDPFLMNLIDYFKGRFPKHHHELR